jgi:hypothetical protein
MATGKGSRHEWLRGWSLAAVLICACRVDNAGLAPATGSGGSGGTGSVSAGAGGAGGMAGATAIGGRGTGGAAGAAGSATAGTTGQAGAAGGGGTGGGPVPLAGAGGEGGAAGIGAGGVAGTGLAGNGGAGTTGTAGTSAAGTAGSDVAGSGGGGSAGGGVAGAAGDGQAGAGAGGAAGTGLAGAGGGAGGPGFGGRGGGGGAFGGCGICPACTHCMNGACTPDQGSMWKVVCVRAAIAQTRPGGDPWDPGLGLGTTTAPDPQCAFWLGNAVASETSVLSNTFTPNWNESITPGSRFSAGLLSSQANPWSIRVTDDDPPTGAETICSISPMLDAAAFASGSATFSAGSCTTLEIGLDCASP